MEKHFAVLERSALLRGIPRDEFGDVLRALHAREKSYRRGEFLLREGDHVRDVGVLLAGDAHSLTNDVYGRETIVTPLRPGDFIAVLLAVSRERESPVSVRAETDASALFFPARRLLVEDVCPHQMVILENLLDGIAEKALLLHERNDCLVRRSVREKILAYLSRQARRAGSGSFTVPLSRGALGAYLDVERSALSRELSRMRQEGILEFERNHFTLHAPE